jgi:hypothetical protein
MREGERQIVCVIVVEVVKVVVEVVKVVEG